jgi:PAS domain-containing protein
MDWPGFEQAGADSGHEMLALVEAEVGPLVEHLPVPILVTSGDGAVLSVNPPAAALLGCAAGLVGQHVDRILEPRNLSARMTTLCHEADAVRLYVLADRPGEVASPAWSRA